MCGCPKCLRIRDPGGWSVKTGPRSLLCGWRDVRQLGTWPVSPDTPQEAGVTLGVEAGEAAGPSMGAAGSITPGPMTHGWPSLPAPPRPTGNGGGQSGEAECRSPQRPCPRRPAKPFTHKPPPPPGTHIALVVDVCLHHLEVQDAPLERQSFCPKFWACV